MNRYTIVAAVGIANVAVLLFTRWEIDPLEYSDGGLLLVITAPLTLLGHFALGAVPGYMLVRYRLAAPLVISGFLTWFAFVDRGGMESFIALYSSPLLHVNFIVGFAIVGLIEFTIRGVLPYISHDPLL